MKMWRLEKLFVNRRVKGGWNVRQLRERLGAVDMTRVREVLEIGCGRGDVAAFLAREYGAFVRAIDLDPDQVALARRAHPESDRLRFSVADASHLPFAAGSFDLVVSQHVFHHLPEWKCVPAEIARVLRADGCVVWQDLAVPAPLKGLARPLASHAGVYTLRDVAHAFGSSGLETRSHRRVWTGPLVHHDLLLQRG